MTERPKLVTIAGALEQLPFSRSTLYELFDSGALQKVKIGARAYILQSSIDDFLEQLKAEQQIPGRQQVGA